MKKQLILILIMGLVLLVGCGKNNEDGKDQTNKPQDIIAIHSFFEDYFNSYIKLSSTLALETGKIIPKHSMTAFMHITNGQNRKILYYQVDWTNNDNTVDRYYRNEFVATEPSRFIAQQFLPFVKIPGDRIKSFSALYKFRTTIDGIKKDYEVKYHESTLIFSENNFKYANNEQDFLTVTFYKDDYDKNNYRFKFGIDFKEPNIPVHIDMQSWIKTTDNEYYPLVGLYHYATNSENYLSVSDEIIPRIVEIENIYVEVIYTTNEFTKVLNLIFNVDELETLPE